MKARLSDNLEFVQWLKRYYDQHYDGHFYDPVSRRHGSQTDFGIQRKKTGKLRQKEADLAELQTAEQSGLGGPARFLQGKAP